MANQKISQMTEYPGNLDGAAIFPTVFSGNNYQVSASNIANLAVSSITALDITGAIVTTANIGGGNISITGNVTGDNVNATTAYLGNISVTGNVNVANVNATAAYLGNITISGDTIVANGTNMTLDPNGSGGTAGNVIIAGNLQVQGTTTTVNSNIISINNLLFNVANNAVTSSEANGGGLGVGPAGSEYAKLTYNSTSNVWNMTNGVSVNGNVNANVFVGNGAALTSLTATNITGTVANATYATTAQPTQ